MKSKTGLLHLDARRRQAGLSMVELLIAVAISLFLSLGLSVSYVSTKRAFTSQDQLAQLQDNERLALTILTNAIQSAGYFPDPLVASAADRLPAGGGAYGTFAQGSGIVGTTGTGSGSASDALTVRYVSATGDGLRNCLGQVNTSGANVLLVNTFSINANNELVCALDGDASTAAALVGNVAGLAVAYGTDTDSDGSADRYLPASTVTANAWWAQVRSARLTLSFVNPFAGEPGQLETIDWTHMVHLKNRM